MPRKLIGAQKPITLLVANLRGSSDPSKGSSGNPVKMRSTFKTQTFVELGGRGPETNARTGKKPGSGSLGGLLTYTTSGVPVASGATVQVSNNTFTGPTSVRLGEYLLTTGEDFTVGGTAAITATNLAAAIDVLPGYSASAALGVVTVVGPPGPLGNQIAFYAEGFNPSNFVFNTSGTLAGAEPRIGPPVIG